MYSVARLVCLLSLALACEPGRAGDPEPTRETMRRVFQSLATLLPATTTPSGWREAATRGDVRDALDTLSQAADELGRHSREGDVSFRFLSGSLAFDARTIEQRVAEQRYESASYLVQRLTETCVSCHVRLPARNGTPFADQLLERVNQGSLSPFTRARLQMATRQFDPALKTFETAFADPATQMTVVESSDVIASYLITALRVRRDAGRAERGLAALARRPDLSAQLESNLQTWRSAVQDLAPALAESPSIERARAILDEGRGLDEFPSDGASLVHAIVASSLLYQYLEERRPRDQDLATALYLLAKTEAFTRRSFELSEARYYLEQSIRTAPHSALAERAYAALEQETLLGYTGSSGEHVPDDVRSRLAELRKLSRSTAAPADAAPARKHGAARPPADTP